MRVLLSLTALAKVTLAVQTVVHLPYATYRGTALSNGVSQWLGLRYAASPVGNLRFAAPQDVPRGQDFIEANAHGPTCLGTASNGAVSAQPSATSNEDCLFLDVYAPSNANRWSNLPVYFFIQGGGFNSNSNANYNGSGLVLASDSNIIVVNFNYRVGVYGFLASSEVSKGGSINNGLKDQRKALQWVQRYIRQFGGDPRRVTLAGDSAGAASVNLQLTAYGGRDDGLFRNSAAESQSFAAIRSVPESQFMYNNLTQRTGCASSGDTLACLRGLSASALQAVNFNVPFPGAADPPLYMYGPTLDYDFIKEYTYSAYANGNFVRLPAIYGDDTNEGTIFTPRNTSSYDASSRFIKDQFPDFTKDQLDIVNYLFPVDNTPTFPDSGRFWRQVSDAYGEIRYICPGIYISEIYAKYNIPGWNYHWNVIDPPAAAAGTGVSHTIEVNAIWGPENTNGGAPASYQAGGVNNPIVRVVQGYWISFVRTSDPNTYRASGTPQWEKWQQGNEYRRLKFETGATGMETVDQGQQGRCKYLSGIGLALKQ
ncbi:hypothetical protein B0A48_14911 [Cryoendolithus antarcticus]|uniref:Carboxylic ester hydrolase n=1 Tax=Cryoendolithus antarcticus TaxID=1507870 RepID=A0A1V8SJB2_9PEZI|nr:hypothetical protein B0A48_14911 [Cryoendolithus antarcticus]